MSKYIRIAVSAVLLAVVAWRTNWSDVAERFANLNIWLWLAAVGVALLGIVASATRWQLFGREMGFERSLGQYSAYYFIGSYFNLLLPTSVGGDVMRVWYLDGKSGRKLAALASVFLERLNGLLVLIAMACVGVLVAPIPLPAWVHVSVWSVAGCAVLGVASMPILARMRWLPLNRREQMKTVLSLWHMPALMAGSTALSILVQVLGVVCIWCVGKSLGLNVPIGYCCILGPMVSLLTLLPISVNGMGVREVGMVVFLAPLSVGEDSAKALAFLWFLVTVAVSLFGGLVYLFGAFPKAEPVNQEANHGSFDRDTDQGREREHPKAA